MERTGGFSVGTMEVGDVKIRVRYRRRCFLDAASKNTVGRKLRLSDTQGLCTSEHDRVVSGGRQEEQDLPEIDQELSDEAASEVPP